MKPIPIKVAAFLLCLLAYHAGARTIGITSMQELAEYAALSGNTVKMKPGVYRLADLLTDELIAQRKKETAEAETRDTYLFLFSGHNNSFDLTDVTIEVDTALLSAFKGCYIREFLITGNRNTIKGLTVTDIGNQPTSRGGNSLSIHGDNTVLNGVTLNVRGSFPYGYGDLLGKGSNSIVRGRKHSGLLVCGTNTKLLGCKVVSRSFGHCFYIQGGINTYFEDCYAEGEMRPTDAMLAETSGPAFDNNFRSVYKPNTIQPGYMKSLQECGFRTYGSGGPEKRKTGAVKLVNCTAKNVRVGFALHADEDTRPVQLENCAGIGCERAFYLNKAYARDCRGDAMHGPLLYLVGEEPSKVDLTLLPETSDMTVHAVATISGKGHEVSIKGSRGKELPIMLGFNPPGAGEISAPISVGEAEDIKLVNETRMPVLVGEKAHDCMVVSNGEVKNNGSNIKILPR